MRGQSRMQLGGQTLASWRGKMEGTMQAGLSGLGQLREELSHVEQVGCGLAYEAQQHLALAPALAAKAAHHPLEVVLEGVGVMRQRGRLRGALRRDGRDELEDFVWAFYNVGASVTR